jgi:hypothetical protein
MAHGGRSCENIEFGFFRPRVFSYLQAKKSGFFNNFTASAAMGRKSGSTRDEPRQGRHK